MRVFQRELCVKPVAPMAKAAFPQCDPREWSHTSQNTLTLPRECRNMAPQPRAPYIDYPLICTLCPCVTCATHRPLIRPPLFRMKSFFFHTSRHAIFAGETCRERPLSASDDHPTGRTAFICQDLGQTVRKEAAHCHAQSVSSGDLDESQSLWKPLHHESLAVRPVMHDV